MSEDIHPSNQLFNLITIITNKKNNHLIKHNSKVFNSYSSIKEDEEVPIDKIKECVPEFYYKELIKSIPYFDQKINITSNSESGHVADSDHVLLSRIFENLISNAIKYSPLNSEIDINLICRLDSCSVEIVDQGEGFDERQKSMLYQQFAKIGNKPTNNESSTGLGLSIVKAACDKLGIGLEVESKKYEGSKFILNFVNNNIK